MRNYLIIVLILFLTSKLYSQSETAGLSSENSDQSSILFSDGIITGFVFDNSSKTPLEGVVVQLINAIDSSLYKGTGTDETGFFKLDQLEQGRYRIIVSLVGYNRRFRNINFTNPDAKILNLDTIYLSSGTETEEIVVEGEKSFIELQADKRVFNVEQNMSVKGGNALDVLKNLPGVTVDIDNNVSLRGGQRIKFMVNGRPVTGDVSRILEFMPADQVSSVELITNPSAKFDAEGSTGVINIVMKKYDDSGVNGQLSLNAGTKDKYGTGLSLNYKTGDYNFTGSYDFRQRNNTFTGSVERNNFVVPSNAQSFQNSDGKMRMEGNNFRGEIEYMISKTDILSLGGRFEKGTRKRGETDLLKIFDSGNSLTEDSRLSSNETEKSQDWNVGLNYMKIFKDKKQSLSGEINFSTSRENEDENKITNYLIPVNTLDLLNLSYEQDNRRQLNVQSDYSHPLGENAKLETGVKYNWRENKADNRYLEYDYNSASYEIDSLLSDNFNFTENIAAVYGIYNNKLGDFSFNVGVRGEYWKYEIDQFNTNTLTSRNRYDIFPSATISQKLGVTEDISLSYSRKVRRPGYRELSPTIRMMNPIFYFKGNPDLGPEYTNSLELNFIKYFSSISVVPSVFYTLTTDKITRVSELIDSNITQSFAINANQEKSYGGELLVNGMFGKDFIVNGAISYYKQEIESDTLGTNSNYTFSGRLFANYTLPFDAAIQLTYFYSGKQITPQGEMNGFNSFDIALRKDFFDKKLSLNLKVSDLLNTSKFGGSMSTSTYSQVFNRQRESRVVMLSLTYKFGTENKDQNRRRRQRSQEESRPDMDLEF
ncbi:MAG TPA: TonB-dependent receptor [Ignavibacteria bacterium]|nr:TonB-dependent receptor [Ignavibacteria bacterium]